MGSTDDREFLRALGARAAEIRRKRGLTQEQVAERLSIDPQSAQRMEVGRSAFSLSRLRKLADVLGVRLRDLLDDPDADVPDAPWDEGAARIVSVWSSIPEDRRELAERVLRQFSRS